MRILLALLLAAPSEAAVRAGVAPITPKRGPAGAVAPVRLSPASLTPAAPSLSPGGPVATPSPAPAGSLPAGLLAPAASLVSPAPDAAPTSASSEGDGQWPAVPPTAAAAREAREQTQDLERVFRGLAEVSESGETGRGRFDGAAAKEEMKSAVEEAKSRGSAVVPADGVITRDLRERGHDIAHVEPLELLLALSRNPFDPRTATPADSAELAGVLSRIQVLGIVPGDATKDVVDTLALTAAARLSALARRPDLDDAHTITALHWTAADFRMRRSLRRIMAPASAAYVRTPEEAARLKRWAYLAPAVKSRIRAVESLGRTPALHALARGSAGAPATRAQRVPERPWGLGRLWDKVYSLDIFDVRVAMTRLGLENLPGAVRVRYFREDEALRGGDTQRLRGFRVYYRTEAEARAAESSGELTSRLWDPSLLVEARVEPQGLARLAAPGAPITSKPLPRPAERGAPDPWPIETEGGSAAAAAPLLDGAQQALLARLDSFLKDPKAGSTRWELRDAFRRAPAALSAAAEARLRGALEASLAYRDASGGEVLPPLDRERLEAVAGLYEELATARPELVSPELSRLVEAAARETAGPAGRLLDARGQDVVWRAERLGAMYGRLAKGKAVPWLDAEAFNHAVAPFLGMRISPLAASGAGNLLRGVGAAAGLASLALIVAGNPVILGGLTAAALLGLTFGPQLVSALRLRGVLERAQGRLAAGAMDLLGERLYADAHQSLDKAVKAKAELLALAKRYVGEIGLVPVEEQAKALAAPAPEESPQASATGGALAARVRAADGASLEEAPLRRLSKELERLRWEPAQASQGDVADLGVVLTRYLTRMKDLRGAESDELHDLDAAVTLSRELLVSRRDLDVSALRAVLEQMRAVDWPIGMVHRYDSIATRKRLRELGERALAGLPASAPAAAEESAMLDLPTETAAPALPALAAPSEPQSPDLAAWMTQRSGGAPVSLDEAPFTFIVEGLAAVPYRPSGAGAQDDELAAVFRRLNAPELMRRPPSGYWETWHAAMARARAQLLLRKGENARLERILTELLPALHGAFDGFWTMSKEVLPDFERALAWTLLHGSELARHRALETGSHYHNLGDLRRGVEDLGALGDDERALARALAQGLKAGTPEERAELVIKSEGWLRAMLARQAQAPTPARSRLLHELWFLRRALDGRPEAVGPASGDAALRKWVRSSLGGQGVARDAWAWELREGLAGAGEEGMLDEAVWQTLDDYMAAAGEGVSWELVLDALWKLPGRSSAALEGARLGVLRRLNVYAGRLDEAQRRRALAVVKARVKVSTRAERELLLMLKTKLKAPQRV